MLLRLTVIFLILYNYTLYADQRKDCNWENESNVPCVEIIKNVNNTSRYNFQSIKDRKSTRLNSSHSQQSRMPSSA